MTATGSPPSETKSAPDGAPVLLSLVAPMHNEADVTAEFVRRCAAVGEGIGLDWELVVCDDASTDQTADRLEAAGERYAHATGPLTSVTGVVRVLRQEQNLGQIGATLTAIGAARGTWIAVLDGDLQDPPEVIPALLHAAVSAQQTPDVVFAVKTSREDPPWFLVGRAGFAQLQAGLGGTRPPDGAGAFCLMSSQLASRVARARVDQANLAPLIMAVLDRDRRAKRRSSPVLTVGYTKMARYDGTSRVGAVGLAREAVGSLELSGALGRGLRGAGLVCGVGAVALAPTLLFPPIGIPAVLGTAWLARRAWRAGIAADLRSDAALRPTE